MTWLTGLITGTATLLGVLIGGRLTTSTERKQWLRDNRLRVCVGLIEQVETFISEQDLRRTEMEKSVGTLIILGPVDLAGQAGILVSRADQFKPALFRREKAHSEHQAFRAAEWSFRAAAAKALDIKGIMTMGEVDQAAQTLAAQSAGESADESQRRVGDA